MKIKTAVTVGIMALAVSLTSAAFAGSKRVKGYTKKDGTYVAHHHRSAPDKSKQNNYSTKGNTNPYTGKKSTVEPNKK